MIASKYVRHPEAMQFQRELWSKSKRDTILMRIAGLIMRGSPVPQWVTDARARARALSEAVEQCCRDWVSEAARAVRRPATGFALHIREWDDRRNAERWQRAAELVRAALAYTTPAAAKSRHARTRTSGGRA